jgi:hypothetical protein
MRKAIGFIPQDSRRVPRERRRKVFSVYIVVVWVVVSVAFLPVRALDRQRPRICCVYKRLIQLQTLRLSSGRNDRGLLVYYDDVNRVVSFHRLQPTLTGGPACTRSSSRMESDSEHSQSTSSTRAVTITVL